LPEKSDLYFIAFRFSEKFMRANHEWILVSKSCSQFSDLGNTIRNPNGTPVSGGWVSSQAEEAAFLLP
jgi:hypothetical protein